MRTLILGVAAAAMAVPAVTVPVFDGAAQARHRDRGYDRDRDYDRRRYYRGCRRGGTTGLIVGGAAGALAGRAIDTRGERTTGTVLGAAAGALLGREIERGRRCR